MRPKREPEQAQRELLQMDLEQLIDMSHPLARLGLSIDWQSFEEGALRLYSEAPQECARFVREALALLSEHQRRTIEMVHFEGLNLKDVAQRTEQTFSNARHHYYRGMAKLKDHLRSVRGDFETKDRQPAGGMEAGRVEA